MDINPTLPEGFTSDTIPKIERLIARHQKKLAEAKKKLLIQCGHCQFSQAIGNSICLVEKWNDGDDRWHDGDINIECQSCKKTIRLNKSREIIDLMYSFKEIVDVYPPYPGHRDQSKRLVSRSK